MMLIPSLVIENRVLSCEPCAIVRRTQSKNMKAGNIRNKHVHSHILSVELLVDFHKNFHLVHFII
jgi:hypothetical protein